MFGCLIQGNTPTGTWGPAWIERGIGGSEQAAVYLAAALQRRGWQVEVYGAFHHVQKRPIIRGKETYYVQKRPIIGGNETYYGAVHHVCSSRTRGKETYYVQKRPIIGGKETYAFPCT